ncbi:MAG: DUF3048 domain-containing protein [Acidimicrobiia bacterium]|nr:DUF3048 domain-containing protein [Acidimicrobiia bacterium]
MTGRRRSRSRIAATLTASLLVVSCGSRSGDSVPQSGEDRALASSVVGDPAGEEGQAGSTDAPDELTFTDFASLGPVYPLTGRPLSADDTAWEARPALVVKIDNHPRARPQTGLEMADIVFDVRAEGVTRFAAVYHSTVPDPVGPVRSSRTSDFDILRGFERPLYASSGGNDYVARKLRTLPIVELTNLTRTEYFRDFSRPAPHNLYVNASDLYQLAPDDSTAPNPWFVYRRADESLSPLAIEMKGPVTIDYTGSPTVTHTWDGTRQGWLRTQDDNPHTTANGDQLAPENVVIMVTEYGVSPADAISPEVRSIGSGPLLVLSDGQAVAGRWERAAAADKPTLTDADGNNIALNPGRTWVLMPEQGQVRFPAGSTPPGWNG